MSEPRPSPPNPSPRGRGKGEGRGSIHRGEQTRPLRGTIITLVALLVWYALRLLPGDITPEAPETALRQPVHRSAPPQRLWQEPRPFPTYDPAVAYSLLDHLDQAALSRRQPPDANLLRRDLAHLRAQLSSRWLSSSGDWRVAGEGVLTCFSPPPEPDRLAAALRPASTPVARLSAQVRFLTPPQPQERAGVTPGLDGQGSGLAFLVGFSGPDTVTCEWVRLEGYRVAQLLTHEEVRPPAPEADQPTSWLTLALAAETGSGTPEGWQASLNGKPLPAVAATTLGSATLREPSATTLPARHPGVLLQSQGTRVAFTDFSLNDTPTDADLWAPCARLAESLRLADLLTLPGDTNFQFRPEGGNPIQPVEIAGVARAALLAPAPSSASVPLPSLRGPCRLQAWVGLHPTAWRSSGAFAHPNLPQSEVRVRVTMRTATGEQELWSRTLASAPRDGQRWTSVDVPLPESAEASALVLQAEGASPGEADVPRGYVVWGNPLIRLPVASQAQRNVILIIIDSLRADALGGGGPKLTHTPTLDRLAEESLAFENAFAQSPWCVPSLATLYSSLWPEVHGADPPDFRTPGSLSPAAVTLAEALRRAGYHTGLVTDEPYPERVGLEQGFEEVISASATGSPLPSALFIQAAGQVGEGVDRPFFLCLHTHHLTQTVAKVLLEPPVNLDRLREKLHARYFAELQVLDQALGEFLEALQSHGLLKDSLLIVTADHGIDLSDRYPTIIPAGAGFTLRDEQLHVPLLLRAPVGRTPRVLAPHRVSAQVRLIDLGPTVCDLLGVASPADWQGESLAPLLREGADMADRPVFASACNLKPERAAVRWRGCKYIRVLDPQEPRGEPFLEPLADEQLYNIHQDAGETVNLAAKAPPLLAEMRALLLSHLEEGARRRAELFPEAAPAGGPSAEPESEGPKAPQRSETSREASPAPAAKAGGLP